MKDELQKKLNGSRNRLVNELNIDVGFLAALMTNDIITSENKATIEVYSHNSTLYYTVNSP